MEAETNNNSSESCNLLYNSTDIYRINVYVRSVDGFGEIMYLTYCKNLRNKSYIMGLSHEALPPACKQQEDLPDCKENMVVLFCICPKDRGF